MRLKLKLLVVAGIVSGSQAAAAVEFIPSGRLHLDYAAHDSDVAQFTDKLLVRRAQFGLEAKFNHDWSAKFVYDFASGGSYKDAYLRYGGWKPADITLGQYKVPFGLEQLTSTNDITFIERSLPSATFSLSRRMGIGFDSKGSNHTLAAMAFGSAIGGSGGQGAAVRFTYSPVNDDDAVVHLGVATSTEQPKGDVNLGTRPESLPSDPRLVRTGTLTYVSRINQLGLEAAWKNGPYSLQGEWLRSHLERSSGRPSAALDGWYVAGSWVLTGESRGYHNGVFKGITPGKSSGAWELTARYSEISLDDGVVRGGKEDNLTLGLNWYVRDYLRIMADYIRVKSDRRGLVDDPNILDVRIQLAF